MTKNHTAKFKGTRFKGVIILLVAICLIVVGFVVSFGDDWELLRTQLFPENYSIVSKAKIKQMKEKGCVYDGLLTPRYNAYFAGSVKMLKNTECRYIHRAIETWNTPPDFREIQRRINVIKNQTGKDFIYGMFLAESIDPTKAYYDPIGRRTYYYSRMCAPGTYGAWGKDTCKPSLAQKEYRQYLSAVAKRAIDLGIEDFTFGQIYYQDYGWKKDSALIRGVIADIKRYGKSKGKEISVGAQTNTIDNEEYLRSFDYITGGVGQNTKGKIERGNSCWSYYYNRDGYCWALLWHDTYKSKANNIFVYLDWNNSSTDDIHRFTRMNREARAKFLGSAYDFFLWNDIGFLMPLGVVLGNVSSGCHGPTTEFYSASNLYSCKDENAINEVLRGKGTLPNHSRFVSQKVPAQMIAGKKYSVEVTMENTGFRIWDKQDGYALGSVAPQDNLIWGINRVQLRNEDLIKHGQRKVFSFEVVAPQEPGEYDFQWRMVQEGHGWFSKPTKMVKVEVVEEADNVYKEEGIEEGRIDGRTAEELQTQMIQSGQGQVVDVSENETETGALVKTKRLLRKIIPGSKDVVVE